MKKIDYPSWKDWATTDEQQMMLLHRAAQRRAIRERKKIRDRCYQRARRASSEGADKLRSAGMEKVAQINGRGA